MSKRERERLRRRECENQNSSNCSRGVRKNMSTRISVGFFPKTSEKSFNKSFVFEKEFINLKVLFFVAL